MGRFLVAALLCCAAAVSVVYAQVAVDLNLDGLDETVPNVVRANEDAGAIDAGVIDAGARGINPPVAAPVAPPAAAPATAPATAQKVSFWYLIRQSGIIGYIIILLSLIAVALIIEYALSIRRSMLMPPGFADEVLKLLVQNQAGVAMQKCKDDPSALAQVLYAGMTQYEFGWESIEKSAEEATAEQASRLYRKVEYLHVIGNIAPMLGLLGTVVGMVMAFQNIADTSGFGRASELAEGIYLALITTIQGLVVAIPCLAAHSFFGNRIASLISETTFVAEQVLQPIKKNLLRKRSSG